MSNSSIWRLRLSQEKRLSMFITSIMSYHLINTSGKASKQTPVPELKLWFINNKYRFVMDFMKSFKCGKTKTRGKKLDWRQAWTAMCTIMLTAKVVLIVATSSPQCFSFFDFLSFSDHKERQTSFTAVGHYSCDMFQCFDICTVLCDHSCWGVGLYQETFI